MTVPWRGTLLYTGTLAAVAVTAAARFAGAADVQPPAVAEPAPTATATSATPDQGAADGSPLSNGRDGSQDDPADGAPTPTAAVTSTPTPQPAAAPPVQAAPPAPAPAPAKPAPAPPAPPTSTTITGSSVQTPYGPVQVAVTFTNHQIASVQTLRHPSGNGTSNQINAYALPILTSEAVAANSASIAAVSGATYTSAGYRQSLQSAIDHRP